MRKKKDGLRTCQGCGVRYWYIRYNKGYRMDEQLCSGCQQFNTREDLQYDEPEDTSGKLF